MVEKMASIKKRNPANNAIIINTTSAGCNSHVYHIKQEMTIDNNDIRTDVIVCQIWILQIFSCVLI